MPCGTILVYLGALLRMASLLTVNPTSWSFPPYSLTLIKLRKSHLGNSSKLKRVFFLVARQRLSKLIFALAPTSVKRVFFLVARQRLSKLIFALAPTSVDCARFGVVNPTSWSFPPSHLGNSSKLDCARFGVGCPLSVDRLRPSCLLAPCLLVN